MNFVRVDPTVISTVVISCPTTRPPTTRQYLINSNDTGTSDDTYSHTLGASPTGCIVYQCIVGNGTYIERQVSMVCFEGKLNLLLLCNFLISYIAPVRANATITGNTNLPSGGSTLLTCTGNGSPPPTVLYD